MGRIADYDRGMQRRLRIIAPLVIIVHFLFFFSFGTTVTPDRTITFGREGPPRLEPEVSILDDQPGTARQSERLRNALSVVDVFIVDEDLPPRNKGKEPTHRSAEKRSERAVSTVSDGNDYYRSYPSHAPVPYREDYVILRMVKPEYPQEALLNGDEGYVLVEVYIGLGGSVEEVWVRSASGPRSFEASALDAVKQFLFKPVSVNGKPVSFWVSFLVRFQLKR